MHDKQPDSPPSLSILLATVTSRAALFAKLLVHVQKQAEGMPVEIITACDNKEISIGKKRQNLLESASGDYVAYIDDDDWVAEDYVGSILEAISHKPDCVGFEIEVTLNGGQPLPAVASRRYRKWADNVDGYRWVRSTYHKTPVLRRLALQVGFPDMRYGEDKLYSDGIMQLVKTEAFIPKQLYFYRYRNEPFHQKYGIEREPQRDYKGRRVAAYRGRGR